MRIDPFFCRACGRGVASWASRAALLQFSVWVIAAIVLGISTASTWGASGVGRYLKEDDAWFRGTDARQIAENILSYQADTGGWPKNTDTTSKRFTGDPQDLHATFDNGATTDELRYLARSYSVTNEGRYCRAFLKGFDYILRAQYPNGGWPQFYPPPANTYHRYITFNDNAMVRLMEFLRETAAAESYAFLDAARKEAARRAFERGIQCILKCQVRVNGVPTAWCAQHDEKDFAPRPGRRYELVSLSGAESVGIVRLLMSLDNPGTDVVAAVEGAVRWFETAKLTGIKVVRVPDKKSPSGLDKRVVADPSAPPIWARFYEIGTNRPIFCDRDGVPKHELSEIGYERRNGYSWLNYWPQSLLEKDDPAWRERWAHAAR